MKKVKRLKKTEAGTVDKSSTEDKVEQINVDSDSSLEYDTELEENEEILSQRDVQKQKNQYEENFGIGHVSYEEACKSLNIVPIRRISEQLPLNGMRLQHVGMNSGQCKALACAFWHNTCLESLDLEDNGLTGEDLVPIINGLRSNIHISSLSLSENEVQVVGAMALDEVLRETTWLTHLNLSGTKLGNKETEFIAAGLQNNNSIRWLDLSHNNIGTNGSKKLGRAIGDTESLQSLNLSWNHIRMEGAVGILKGLQKNSSLINLDLSMNGLGFEGSLALEETLRENRCLKFFDVSNNRINWEGVSYVAKGLRKNGTLQMLKIGSNPINMEGCYELLKAAAHRRSKVMHIALDNVPVNGAVLTVANEIMKMRQFTITHGGVLDTRDVVGIRKEKPEDPITLVVRYLASVGIRIIDLFRMFDSDNDGQVSKREFIRGLKRVGVPLPDRDLVNVATRLDKSKKGYISYGLLSNGVRNHIREERKEDKRQEVKKRNRLEERRRILQTELPEIYKRTYEDDLFMFYASQSSANLGSTLRSSTNSMHSLNGGQVVSLPAIESGSSSHVSNNGFNDSPQTSYADSNQPTESESNIVAPRSLRSKRNSLPANIKSNDFLRYIHSYLERKKTQANIDTSIASNVNV
ncbi:leucine-rich repeat-containing protein 74A-like [Mercenaria mercenaria]|uniref:leucine-rich repeat-containing protein 74A-like n=1 Tax=Mercenaria mercenaria TaxID=6596 RepID=UPI00234EEDA4|nr:leucine-rich repeat-containing protein 74A-like [Mercenaria mercenaria]